MTPYQEKGYKPGQVFVTTYAGTEYFPYNPGTRVVLLKDDGSEMPLFEPEDGLSCANCNAYYPTRPSAYIHLDLIRPADDPK